jgi:hypothetical protein
MNQLTKFLVNELVDGKSVTAIYGGGFKPPTKGHFDLVKTALKDFKDIDKFIIYVGGGIRDGIEQEQSLQVWDIYKELLPSKVQIEPSSAPIGDILRYAKNHPDEKVYFIIGYREGREDDLQDVISRTKGVEEKYPNVEVRVIKTPAGDMSGTNARKALQKGDKEKFFTFLPTEIPANEKEDIYNILEPTVLKEGEGGADTSWTGIDNETITLQDILELTKDIKIQNFPTKELASIVLNWDNNPEEIERISQVEVSSQYPILIMVDEQGKIQWILDGNHRAQKALSAKAETIPAKLIKPSNLNSKARKILLGIVDERLKKENVAPNHDGKAAPYGSGYKPLKENTIPSIDILEKIAELTNYMREKGYNIDPVPSIELVGDDVDNAEKFLGKTAYYDPINKSITLYTYGRHPKDIVRSYAHEMIHHIQNLEDRLGDVSTTNTLEDDHINDLEKEANLKGTMTFRNWTDSIEEDGQKTSNKNMDDYKKQNNPSGKVKDPFGLNQFARELAQGLEETLNEGRYDKLTNELSSFAFELMKDGYDVGKKVVDELFVVGPADEDSDIISDEFEFDFVVQAVYTDDVYSVNGGANAGYIKKGKKKQEIQPLLTVRFEIPKNVDWQTVSFDIKDVIRHELEHLTQDGANVKGVVTLDDPRAQGDPRLVRPGKQMADDEFLRDMIDADLLPKSDYFKLEKEVDSMLQGMYFKAKKSRKPFLAVIDDYFDKQPVNQEERKEILGLWAKRAKALGLPPLSSASVKETSYLHDTGVEKKDEEMREKKYVIFCDMDGVLVDFDEGYKQLTGVTTQHADSQGKNEFWSLFRDSLKNKDISERSYWANLDWMSDGKQLWDYISPYNPYVLTAPSVNFDIPFEERYKVENNESMQGKTEWVQRLPNMRKIYFRSAARKADFAGPNKILIDDRKDTIDSWNANGGIGILHTSTANTIKQLQELGL